MAWASPSCPILPSPQHSVTDPWIWQSCRAVVPWPRKSYAPLQPAHVWPDAAKAQLPNAPSTLTLLKPLPTSTGDAPKPLPQQTRSWAVATPHVWPSRAEILPKAYPATAVVGMKFAPLVPVEPIPSWPALFAPQQNADPEPRSMAQTWPEPTDTDAKLRNTFTAIGLVLHGI